MATSSFQSKIRSGALGIWRGVVLQPPRSQSSANAYVGNIQVDPRDKKSLGKHVLLDWPVSL